MSFLDKPMSELSLAELRRLISTEVSAQIPAIPAGVAGLDDSQSPVVHPPTQNDQDVLTYDAAQGIYVAQAVPSTSPVTPPTGNTPTVSGGIGYIVASWEAVANDTPVTYDVYLDTSSPVTASNPGTFIASTDGTMIFIRTDGAGDALVYDQDYYVAIIARSDDQAASQSATSAAVQLVQVNSGDVAADAIWAGTVAAGHVTTDVMDATITLSGIIRTATSGARIEIVGGGTGGITLYDSSGTVVVSIPTVGTATFNGNVVTGGLVVTDTAVIQGANNYMDKGSVLTLTEKLNNPAFTPLIAGGYDKVEMVFPLSAPTYYQSGYGVNYTATGGSGGATPMWLQIDRHLNQSTGHSGLTLREYDYTTGVVGRSVPLTSGEPLGSPVSMPVGACKIGANIYAFYSSTADHLICKTITNSTFAVAATTDLGGTTGTLLGCDHTFDMISHQVAMGTDGTNPWIFSFNSSSKLPNRMMVDISTPTAPTLGSATSFSTSALKLNTFGDANNPGTNMAPTGVMGAATADAGVTWLVAFQYQNSTGGVMGSITQAYTAGTSAIVAKQEIYQDLHTNAEYECIGLTYDGTNYWWTELGNGPFVSGTSSVQRKLSNLTWDYTGGSAIYLGTSLANDTTPAGTTTCAAASSGAVSLVGNRGSGSIDTTFSLTWTAATSGTSVAAGNKIIISLAIMDATPNTLDSVSGGSLTWTIDSGGTNADGESTYIISADAPSGLASGTTLTFVEHTGGSVFARRRYDIEEYSGLGTGAPAAGNASSNNGTSTTPSPGTTANSALAGDLAVSVIGYKATSTGAGWTVTSGYTQDNTLSANSRSGWMEHRVLASNGAITASVTTTVTAAKWAASQVFYGAGSHSPSDLVVTHVAHGLAAGTEVYFTNSGGSLPSGLSANTPYYVVSSGLATDTFKVSATRGGSNLAVTGTDSGTTTLHVIYETLVSPLGTYTPSNGGTTSIAAAPAMRQKVQITTAGVPSGASALRTYAKLASSAPATTAMFRQPLTTNVSSETAAVYTLLAYTGSGAAPETSNNFPGTTAAVITGTGAAITAPWKLGGDGVFKLPQMALAQRLAGQEGLLAYDTVGHDPITYDGTRWKPVRNYHYARGFEMTDDMNGGASGDAPSAQWTAYTSNGGVITGRIGSVAYHPGITAIETGTTSNATGLAGMRMGFGASAILGIGSVRMACIVRFQTITTPFFNFRFGVSDATFQNDPTSVGFLFRWNNNVNSGKFQRSIGGTYADTGAAAVVAGTWYLLEIVVSADATSAEFFINGVSVGTSSGAAQTTTGAFFGCGVDKSTSSATTRQADIDLMHISGEFSANRFG